MKFLETSPNLNRNTKNLTPTDIKFSKHVRKLSEDVISQIKSEINEYYFIKGWGLKIVARNVLGVTYTNCRSLFKILNLEYRKGYAVCNDFLKSFRKEKAIQENSLNEGFNSSIVKRYAKATTRGVQGFYYNKSTNSYVWLRSTWEFIYAKFLNKIGVNWKTEQTYYNLSDDTKYSPDFYIYNSNWNLEKIVEIKGYYDNHAYKCDLLKSDNLIDSSIEILLVRDINLYLEENLTYNKELITWKMIRKSKESLLEV